MTLEYVVIKLRSGRELGGHVVAMEKHVMNLLAGTPESCWVDVVFNLRSGTLLGNHVAAMDKHVMHLEDVVIKLRSGRKLGIHVVAMEKHVMNLFTAPAELSSEDVVINLRSGSTIWGVRYVVAMEK